MKEQVLQVHTRTQSGAFNPSAANGSSRGFLQPLPTLAASLISRAPTASHQVNPQSDSATPTILTLVWSHTQFSSWPLGFTPLGTHAESYPA